MSENSEFSNVNETENIEENEISTPSKFTSFVKEVFSWIVCVAVAVAIAFVIRNFVFMNVTTSN